MMLFDTHPLVVDKHLAAILGLNEAIVLQQVHYWIEINKKNNNNFHDGRYWTYNTINDWQEEFPFWSAETVKRIFKRLRKRNLVITNNYNKIKRDRTLWYTINYEELEKITSEEYFHEEEDSNLTKCNDASCPNEVVQNEPMEEVKLTSPLPEISTEISIQSINPSRDEDNIDGQTDRHITSLDQLKIKYERIIENCEIHAIDEKYRAAVAHAIKLLLLDIEKNKRIKIGDNSIPIEIVERDIGRLNFFVIEHGVNKFKEASERVEIRNPVGYLKACIFNAMYEMEIGLDSRLRYDGVI